MKLNKKALKAILKKAGIHGAAILLSFGLVFGSIALFGPGWGIGIILGLAFGVFGVSAYLDEVDEIEFTDKMDKLEEEFWADVKAKEEAEMEELNTPVDPKPPLQ